MAKKKYSKQNAGETLVSTDTPTLNETEILDETVDETAVVDMVAEPADGTDIGEATAEESEAEVPVSAPVPETAESDAQEIQATESEPEVQGMGASSPLAAPEPTSEVQTEADVTDPFDLVPGNDFVRRNLGASLRDITYWGGTNEWLVRSYTRLYRGLVNSMLKVPANDFSVMMTNLLGILHTYRADVLNIRHVHLVCSMRECNLSPAEATEFTVLMDILTRTAAPSTRKAAVASLPWNTLGTIFNNPLYGETLLARLRGYYSF